ncbi:MAG: hypothetical protein EPN97_01255 [Alphaproteobacteria bacterium]|nr:MAG: hypothetical protein EPN97_01255 [Alphaproteobacteria bacterium]
MADAVPKKPMDDAKPDSVPNPPSPLPPKPANDSIKPPEKPADASKTEPAGAAPAATAPPPATPVTEPPPPPAAEPPKAQSAPAFNTAAVIVEHPDKSSLPRKPESGFEKFLRLVGMGDLVEAARRSHQKSHHIAQAIFDKIGFGDIYKAAKQPHEKKIQKVVGISKAVGKKIADMIAGRFVSGSFRLIAITFVAGMIGGVTGWGSIGLLALATGAASAIYTYGKEYLGDRFTGPKEERKKVKLFERKRVESAGKAFLSGTFNGALGAWLANLPIFQSVMKLLHDTIHQGIGQISKPFNEAAAPKFSGAGPGILSKFSAAAGRAPPAPAEIFPAVWKMRAGPRPAFGF